MKLSAQTSACFTFKWTTTHLNVEQAQIYATHSAALSSLTLCSDSEFLKSCEFPVYHFGHIISLPMSSHLLPKTLQVCQYLCWSWSVVVMTGSSHFSRTALQHLPAKAQMAVTAYPLFCCTAAGCGQPRKGSCSLKSHMWKQYRQYFKGEIISASPAWLQHSAGFLRWITVLTWFWTGRRLISTWKRQSASIS